MSEKITLRHKDGNYSHESFVPPKVSDEVFMDWFRNTINPPYVLESDLRLSQDNRYVSFFLYAFARTLHAKTIVEIGVAEGTTTYPLLKAASEMEGGIVHSIDPASTSAQLAGDMVRRNGLESWWQFHHMESDSFFDGPGKDLSIDFAFIDGDHSHQGVYTDATNVIERLVPGGMVVFHDLNQGFSDGMYSLPRDRSPDSSPQAVIRVLAELFMKYDIEGFPLVFGACGPDRVSDWTEGASYVVRKCVSKEVTLRTRIEPHIS